MSLLESIEGPFDLKVMDYPELEELARQIRDFLIRTCSKTGGHLAPSLGAVELIIALERYLDLPFDKLFFDVGHQAYAHKILTGRLGRFDTLRSLGGVTGFTRREESDFDSHDSGHASDSLSTALGYCYARDLAGGTERVAALIGDGAIGGGLAFEALNHMGQNKTPFIIVLNDNTMSISKNVGALSIHLARARTNSAYKRTTSSISKTLSGKGDFAQAFLDMGLRARDSIKQLLLPGMLFEEMGVKYIGPIDGHDIRAVTSALEVAENAAEPVIVHCVTRKGKGYPPAEDNPELFHGVGPFDVASGAVQTGPSTLSTYTEVFSKSLVSEAENDPSIVGITAAMPSGTGLDAMAKRHPSRFFDVGIAEEHAVSLAGGLALRGAKPVVAIYSTFLQRAYDEIITNICLPKLHVVFALDRAGIVGPDGATHTGAFDMAYLRSMPNMTVIAPFGAQELADAVHTALKTDGPVAIRYPRAKAPCGPVSDPSLLEIGCGRVLREGCDLSILAIGHAVGTALRAADLIQDTGLSVRVVDMRFVKPLDLNQVELAAKTGLVVALEEGCEAGGFGSAVLEELSRLGLCVPSMLIGIPDMFLPCGNCDDVRGFIGLDAEAVAGRILCRLSKLDG